MTNPNGDDSNLLIDTTTGLENQKPKIQLLTKDKLGGTNFQTVEVQSNRLNKRYLNSLLLENLFLTASLPEVLTKAFLWLSVGGVTSSLCLAGLTGLVISIPIWLTLWFLVITVENTPLMNTFLYYFSLFTLAVVLTNLV